jgi:hypothetical protein
MPPREMPAWPEAFQTKGKRREPRLLLCLNLWNTKYKKAFGPLSPVRAGANNVNDTAILVAV